MSIEDDQNETAVDRAENEDELERASFEQSETRRDEMSDSLEAWVEQFAELSNEARASAEFQAWLDVQSRFHEYSYRNTLLIKQQCPGATKVAGYQTWVDEFERYVQQGESAIWIWAPIIAKRCPECGNSKSYHARSDCGYDEMSPGSWERGLVGFKPVPVFDVSQTDGEPLPELETGTVGDSGAEVVDALLDGAPELGVRATLVPAEEWGHGAARGACTDRSAYDCALLVEVKDTGDRAGIASVLAHEYAHALLHFDVDDPGERIKREVEAESVAYVVSRYFGLDASRSAFYVAAWNGDPADVIRERLERITSTAQTIIEAVAAVE